MKLSERIRFSCIDCDIVLRAPASILEKTAKCPKCQTKITPKEHLVDNSSQAKGRPQVVEKKEKSHYKGLLILNLIMIPLILLVILYENEIEYDLSLLEPTIYYDTKNKEVQRLNEQEVLAIVNSYNDTNLLPTPFQIPEVTPNQDRPTRHYLKKCVLYANKLLAGENPKPFKYRNYIFDNNYEILNQAYVKTKSPLYLNYLLKEFLSDVKPSTLKIRRVLGSIALQKNILKEVSSNDYICSIAKIKNYVDESLKNMHEPLGAVELMNIALLLPKGLDQELVIHKVKPILEDAFRHINKARQDGYFLTSFESAEFSKKLIDLSWQYYLEKKAMPPWLYQLVEKESCRLAYRLEPDGCLPVWVNRGRRINLCRYIYKASLMFDRDDLRFIAHGGRRIKDAYPPKQKDFYFPEIGIAVIRTNWNIYHDSNPHQNTALGGEKDVLQFSFDALKKSVSIYFINTHLVSVVFENEFKVQDINVSGRVISFGDVQIKYKEDKRKMEIHLSHSEYNSYKITNMGKLFARKEGVITMADRVSYHNDWTRIKSYHLLSIDEDASDLYLNINLKNKMYRTWER